MTNPKTGCITVPGSPCREGGHRILDGPLAAAIESFTTRSDPGLLPRLNVLLGALTPAHAAAPSSGPDAITGTGPNARLSPEYTRANDLPERITAYATTGQLPNDSTWRSHSEARQAVLAHAVLHGHSLATVTALMAPGRPWHTGLATAYTRYHHHAGTALTRDWQKALTWAAATAHLFRPACAQEQVHTGGTTKGTQTTAGLVGERTGVAGHPVRRTPLQMGRSSRLSSPGNPRCTPRRDRQRSTRGRRRRTVPIDRHRTNQRDHRVGIPARHPR